MKRIKSGQRDSEPSFSTVLFQLRSGSAFRFTVMFGLVDGIYEISCNVFRNLYSEVFNTTVTEDYETIIDTTPNLAMVHGNDTHVDYTRCFHGVYGFRINQQNACRPSECSN